MGSGFVQGLVLHTGPEAFPLVDRVLASPRYGERWARPWLDMARYADTKGYERDPHREIWQYRDWLIKAFNEDKPFDEFTIEQLAGLLQSEAGVKSQPLVVPIQPGGDRFPFFCIPGHNDNPFIFKDLARYLGPDQPFYAFQSPGPGQASSIEQMATLYLEELRRDV